MGSGMLPYWYDEEYSKIILGDRLSPGKVLLSGHERTPRWNVQQAKGTTGSSTVLEDPHPVGSFTATFYLAEQRDFDEWEDFQRLIESTTSGAKPFALPVYHPDLARNRYTEVTNAGIGGFVHDGQGGVSIACKFQEFRPPKPKPAASPTAKPGGTAASGIKTRSDPNAKAKAELAELLDQAKRA